MLKVESCVPFLLIIIDILIFGWGGASQEGHVKDFDCELLITLVPPLPIPHIQMLTHRYDRTFTLCFFRPKP